MSLLSRHVSQLTSEEFVLGVSTGFKGEAGTRFDGIESTKIVIVSTPASKNWTGYTAIEQAVADSSVGAAMAGKAFPARCNVTYRRVAAVEKKQMGDQVVAKDVEKLVVVGIEYVSQVDLVDVKVPAKAA